MNVFISFPLPIRVVRWDFRCGCRARAARYILGIQLIPVLAELADELRLRACQIDLFANVLRQIIKLPPAVLRLREVTVLLHDAYIRLEEGHQVQHWNSRGHFFGAAAEAMR